jgi:hypothetical protein
MADKTKTLAEIGFNPKFDENAEVLAKTGPKQRAPASAGEIEQRRANKAKHSERVNHGGRPASGSKA